MSLFSRRGFSARAGDVAEALFADTGEGLALLDRAGSVVRANPRFQALVPAAVGQTLWPGLPAQIAPALQAALQAKRPLCMTAAAAEPQHLVLRFALQPMRHGMGLLRVSDQTEQQPRLDSQGQAQRLQAVGALAGGIAHDFNNLLTAIVGSVDDLDLRLTAPEDQAELRQIRESSARGAALVRQLLAFSRQQTLQPRVVSLNAAVEAAASLLRRLVAPLVAVDLLLEAPERLVRIDPTQLDQVLLNLAVNAGHAMPDGGTLTIASRACIVIRPRRLGADWVPPGRYAELRISDTGKGMPPDLLPRIFEPFFTTKRDSGGTGLGLATVYGIVHQSGGFMGVESTPGEGTSFEILLPRYEEVWLGAAPLPAAARAGTRLPESAHVRAGVTDAATHDALAPHTVAADMAAPDTLAQDTVAQDTVAQGRVAQGRDTRPAAPAAATAVSGPPPLPAGMADDGQTLLLLVEDEAAVRRLAARALGRAGLTILAAGSAEEALERLAAAQSRPRLAAVVSDVVMPGMDGTALVRRLRADQPGLPACLMSGYADAGLREALAADDIVFLGKPFAIKDLVQAVVNMLAGRPAHTG